VSDSCDRIINLVADADVLHHGEVALILTVRLEDGDVIADAVVAVPPCTEEPGECTTPGPGRRDVIDCLQTLISKMRQELASCS
jgi:hypothetical protein